MDEDTFERLRVEMLWQIEAEALLTAAYTGRPAFSAPVMAALGRVPRHEFVPAELQPYAYLNRPLPIGFDKTVSQPYIVALMTDLLELHEEHVVLEVGAGAGYQAAILAELASRVYTIDIIEELAVGARRRLQRLGYRNIEVRVGNGYHGWPEHGPYDRIIVTAGCDLVPAPLLAQLKRGGRMVIPTGLPDKQALTLVEKPASGALVARDLLAVRFSELEDPDPAAGLA